MPVTLIPDASARPRVRTCTSFHWLLILCCCVPAARAQYVIDSWTTDKGLPQNSVLSIQQTPDGYLWFTTFDGLVRFDGVRFTVFNKGNSPGLTSNRFVRLFCEPDGTLWAATEDGGVMRYRQGNFQAWTTANGLPTNTVMDIQRDIDGSAWIQTPLAVSHLSDKGYVETDSARDWKSFKTYISPTGSRWEVDRTSLLLTRNGRSTRYPLPFDPLHPAPRRGPFSVSDVRMVEGERGVLWLAAAGRLYRIDGNAVSTYTAEDGMPQSFIRAMMYDRDGKVWLATVEQGACRFADRHFTCIKAADGLSSDITTSISQDREGAIWVGTNNRGLNRLTPGAVTSISSAAGFQERNVYPILADHLGDVWAGTTGGLAQIRGQRVIRFLTRSDGLHLSGIESLSEDHAGRLWIGGSGFVQYYVHGRFHDFTPSLQQRGVGRVYWCIHEDSRGALWFGTDSGLLRYQDGELRRFSAADGLPSEDVKTVIEARDGSFWAGTYGGLARLEGERFVAYTERDGLASNHIRALYEDTAGTLWVGTYDGGLSRFRDGKFTNYTTATGLFSNGVFKILEDARGNFWMSSNQGIYRVSRRQLEDVAAGKSAMVTSTSFGKSDGMLNAECNGGREQAGTKTPDGKLWFPTQDGVVVIDPEAVPHNLLPPPVVIESAKVETRPVPLTGGLTLEPNLRNIEIRYTGLSLVKPDEVRFRYRLESLDSHWVEAGTVRAAFYPYLPPGRYVFRVIAANSDLVWNQQGASLAIVVLPPFYRTWWFAGLTCLTAAGLSGYFWRRRVTELQRAHDVQLAFSRQLIESQESERKRMAAELHDSLGQHLLIIKNRSALGERLVESQGQSKEQFGEITASATQAIDEVRRIAYNLRPPNLERLGLTAAIEELIEKVSSSSGIQFFADVTPLDGALPPEGTINLYRIVQESVNNIVKHGGASKASIEILRENAEIHVRISDNGRGFDVGAPGRRGLGLTSIAERVRMLHGDHTLTSAPGKGTTLTILIPAQNSTKGAANGS
jgi:signal transduction histidine kinase/ligand-binding sensor domain-containing protein